MQNNPVVTPEQTPNPWPENSDYGKRWQLGYEAGRADSFKPFMKVASKLAMTQASSPPDEMVELIDQLKAWPGIEQDALSSTVVGDLMQRAAAALQSREGNEVAEFLIATWDRVYGDGHGWKAFKSAVDDRRYDEALEMLAPGISLKRIEKPLDPEPGPTV